jgi:hypothetical protein
MAKKCWKVLSADIFSADVGDSWAMVIPLGSTVDQVS